MNGGETLKQCSHILMDRNDYLKHWHFINMYMRSDTVGDWLGVKAGMECECTDDDNGN